MNAYDPNKEELFHVAGDMDTGISTTARLDRNKHEIPIRYKGKHGDWVVTADVYFLDGNISAHIICPKCRNALWIRQPNKQLEFDLAEGVLSCEASKCTWEMGRSDATSGDRIEFGLGLCNFTFAIDKNRMRDA